ncbi:MAG TPA: c-type cytochrome [Gammaproteobacteria bacterium]
MAGLLFIPWVMAIPGVAATASAESADSELGRRIFEQGILPDGSPLRALRAGSLLLEGKSAACATCHRHSGMGSVEGSGATTVLVPPVAGPLLFKPARFHGHFLDSRHHWVPNDAWARALARSAYDEKSLGRALREGWDADGKRLLAPMPHYALDEQAVAALAAYLKQLGAVAAPGVEADTLHLATVITPDAPAGQADTVLGVLRAWATRARGVAKPWRLQVWELTGPPESWGEQLQARYRQQPVFAVLSGVGGAQWSRVHRFCEVNRVPCILPSVEIAPEHEDDYYPVYYSPGAALEARVLARHLITARPVVPEVVQLFSDATGSQAAQTLRSHLETGAMQPNDRLYSPENPAAALTDLPRDGALVLWLRPAELQQLVAIAPQGPDVQHVFFSALLASPEELVLPPAWKARVSWVSLFDDMGLQAQIARARLQRWLKQHGLPHSGSLRLQADAYAACYLFTSALSVISAEEVRRHPVPLSREHLLESLETLVNKYSDGTQWVDPDSHVAYYGRMSLGPGQRMAVRGGSLLRYAPPELRKLVMVSGRIVP